MSIDHKSAIWHRTPDIDRLNQRGKDTLMHALGITFTAYGNDWLSASMPVDARTRQPFGRLHGGASAALAETVGSVASLLTLDWQTQLSVGLDINANHVRGAFSGQVHATATPLHLGRSTQVWQIHIRDDHDKLACIARLTMAIMARQEAYARGADPAAATDPLFSL